MGNSLCWMWLLVALSLESAAASQQDHRQRAIIRISESMANRVADKHAKSVTANNFTLDALKVSESIDGLQYTIENVTLRTFEGIRSLTDLQDGGNISLTVMVEHMSLACSIKANFHSIFRFEQTMPVDFFRARILGTLRFEMTKEGLKVRLLECVFDFAEGTVGRGTDLGMGVRHAFNQIIKEIKGQFSSQPQMCKSMAGPLATVISELVSNQGFILSSFSAGSVPPVSLIAVHVRNDSMLIVYQIDKGDNSDDIVLSEEELSPFTDLRDIQISLGENFLNVILDNAVEPMLTDQDGKFLTLLQAMLRKEALQLVIPRLMETFPSDVDLKWMNQEADVTIHIVEGHSRADVILSMELWATTDCQTIHVFTTTWDLKMGIVVYFNSSSIQLQTRGLGGSLNFTDSSIGKIKNAALVAIFRRIAAMPNSILTPLNEDIPAISLASILPSDMAYHQASVQFKEGHLIYEADVGPRSKGDSPVSHTGKGLQGATVSVHDGPVLRTLPRQRCDVTDSAPSVVGRHVVVAAMLALSCMLS